MADDNDDPTAEFPVVCSTCLGPNPYVRMQKIPGGGECHVSGRPYTVWRWRPGADARYKKTVVSPEVARARHVCQVCLLDLDYGVPVQVRDALLAGAAAGAGGDDDGAPRSAVGVEFALHEQERRGLLGAVPAAGMPGGAGYGALAAAEAAAGPGGGGGGGAGGGAGGALAASGGGNGTDGALALAPGSAAAVRELERLRDRRPYYERNRARVCSFFVRGECNRGAACPYRHEMPSNPQDGLSRQNMRDRYYGAGDPVAAKMLARSAERRAGAGPGRPPPEPPADRSVTTLFVGGLDGAVAAPGGGGGFGGGGFGGGGGGGVTEDDLRAELHAHGQIEGVRVMGTGIAFVTFATREGAERAVAARHASLEVRGARLRLAWASSGGGGGGGGAAGGGHGRGAPRDPMQPAAPPPPAHAWAGHQPFPPPGHYPPRAGGGGPALSAGAAAFYPSMDPSAMGSAPAGGGARGGGPPHHPGQQQHHHHHQRQQQQHHHPQERHPQQQGLAGQGPGQGHGPAAAAGGAAARKRQPGAEAAGPGPEAAPTTATPAEKQSPKRPRRAA